MQFTGGGNMSLQSVMAVCEKELRDINVPIRKVEKITFNDRITSTIGRCAHGSKKNTFKIEITSKMKGFDEKGGEYLKALKEVIIHELIHTCDGAFNHGYLFKHYAFSANCHYGYNIQRLADYKHLGVGKTDAERKKEIKYAVKCTRCGALFERTRETKIIKYPERYHCRCGGALVRVGGVLSPEKKDTTKYAANMAAAYSLTCESCGKVYARKRMSAAVRNPERYKCTCGGKLFRSK